MKNILKKSKFYLYSLLLVIASIVMLGFDSESFSIFIDNFFKLLVNSAFTGIGIYIVAMISGWLIFPFLPKDEDFENAASREKYFKPFKTDLIIFIYTVILASLVFNGVI